MNKIQKYLRYIFKILMSISLINRWIVFILDVLFCLLGFATAVLITDLNGHNEITNYPLFGVIFILCNLSWFVVFKSYRGLIRHSNLIEMWRPIVSIFFSCVILFTVGLLFNSELKFIFLFVERVFLISVFALLFMRFFVVLIYNHTINYTISVRNKSLIYGIDTHSIAIAQWLNTSSSLQHQVQGFISRNKDAHNTRIHGLPIHHLNGENIDWFLRKNEVNTVIFPDYASVRDEQNFISMCIDMGISILVTPPFENLDDSKKVRFQMKAIQFEDLLGREEIQIDLEAITKLTDNKTILITGAAGSIGSELVRQIARFKPKLLLLFDNAETALHNLQLEIEKDFPTLKFIPIIGDVRSEDRLHFVFRTYHPEIIYHAAAYKHVPLMEQNPCEAILVNVLGTMNLSNIALLNKVESFVMISTDKAVNPTNVMGASKRIAEIYVQSLAKECKKSANNMIFVTTRFGNVLGSNGSVIPYFKEQIEKGGPITVTDPEIVRYFMTIPEACRLVLEASSFGNSGEIYVFDMGKPVKIVDLAIRMIKLAGYIPYKDIDIQFIGLRPGEKLYEELLNDAETTIPTHHDKITVASVRQYEFDKVLADIQTIIAYSKSVDIKNTIKMMKQMIPEFISNNSPFSEFDV